MKKTIIALCAIAGMLWTGCKEKDAPLTFGTTSVSDTTYVLTGTLPAANPHNVLVEEFTGQSCSNCPAAHTLLEGISTANPGRINIIGMYIKSGPQTNPPPGARYSFTDSTCTAITADIYPPVPALPTGGVDRIPYNGSLIMYSSDWSGVIATQLGTSDPLNLSVTSSYNAVNNVDTIVAKVTYLQNVTTNQSLSIVVVEDSITDLQEDGLNVDPAYVFTSVFRNMVTAAPTGDQLGTSAVKEPGRVFQKVYLYSPHKHNATDADPVPAHLRIIAFVNSTDGTNKQVVQSVQTKLLGH